jgi:hypothetical protein
MLIFKIEKNVKSIGTLRHKHSNNNKHANNSNNNAVLVFNTLKQKVV